jgi:hypothetical protein
MAWLRGTKSPLAHACVRRVRPDEDVVLVLGGIHAAPEFVAGLPEGGVKFGFLESHGADIEKETERTH